MLQTLGSVHVGFEGWLAAHQVLITFLRAFLPLNDKVMNEHVGLLK